MTEPVKAQAEALAADARDPEVGRFELGRHVGRVASLMDAPQGQGLSTGDLAELRRISPSEPFSPALWKVLLQLGLDESPAWISQTEWERRWAFLMMAMATSAGLHDYGVPFGRALACAGWSELRFARLMRVQGTRLAEHLRRTSHYLASKSQPANWADAAKLLFYQSGDAAEDIRITISRTYYGQLYAAERAQG